MTFRPGDPLNCGVALEPSDDISSNPSAAPTFGDIAAARMGRRGFLKGALGTTAYAALGMAPAGLLAGCGDDEAGGELISDAGPAPGSLPEFEEIAHGVDETHHVAPGYSADILIRWGDPLFVDSPDFVPGVPDPDAQERQFGYNNDYVGFIPIDTGGNGKRALLCVNHEFTSRRIMFPKALLFSPSKEIAETEMAAHGGTVVEITRGDDGKWRTVRDSPYNRRITTRSTAMELRGPAAGHDRLRTSEDPTGTKVIGTLNNCAGGITPWGTYLMAEENFHFYFTGQLDDSDDPHRPVAEVYQACLAGEMTHPEARNYCRYGVGFGGGYDWGRFFDRFDINKEPNEPNRFGWVVEVDPQDPSSTPVKHTALGRFKHEGAESIVNTDGRIVIYSGDDQQFDYLYRFVSAQKYDKNNREAAMRLLDEGTLSVAKFHEDGAVSWLPLTFGEGPLTEENDFHSQADVLIETRRAADLLGATPMDRPEDVQPNPATGKVYVALTNNSRRLPDQTDAVHQRAANFWGLIVELTPPNGDHAAETMTWDVLVEAGPPAPIGGDMPADTSRLDSYTSIQYADAHASWNPATSANGWFSCPDNMAVDPSGRLWVATDQGSAWAQTSGTADGIWALGTEGDVRAVGRMFFRVPVGAEMCGPCFDTRGETLFVAVQHPGTDGVLEYKPHGRASHFDDPMTRWPDFKDGVPPRPSVVAITKEEGGRIG